VVFWQTDEHDQPAIVTERYEKAFSAANIAREQAFYDSELKFTVRLIDTDSSRTATVSFKLEPKDSFPKVFENVVRKAFTPSPQPSPSRGEGAKKLPPPLRGGGKGEGEFVVPTEP